MNTLVKKWSKLFVIATAVAAFVSRADRRSTLSPELFFGMLLSITISPHVNSKAPIDNEREPMTVSGLSDSPFHNLTLETVGSARRRSHGVGFS